MEVDLYHRDSDPPDDWLAWKEKMFYHNDFVLVIYRHKMDDECEESEDRGDTQLVNGLFKSGKCVSGLSLDLGTLIDIASRPRQILESLCNSD